MLTDDELLASPVVANCVMNRERGLSGVNSYERELKFNIWAFLEARARDRGRAVWYDACCGEGRALAEAGEKLARTDWGCDVQIIGADLLGMFAPVPPNVRLYSEDVVTFAPTEPLDLITCVHGLHYLGDKLGFLERAYPCLASGGILMAHLDASNVRDAEHDVPLWPQLARRLRMSGIPLSFKQHLLSVTRQETTLAFEAVYQGATASRLPNYTGIKVIDSWYRLPGC